ncbi:ISAs1 family transposase [Bradyrhizobium sp. IC3069]|nr:ISAs1 family transposase [Bradyrhizobium sp. IC4059]MCA1520914.1 ISAs1 family transposase [Bradyrhizobium sp. IC3069]
MLSLEGCIATADALHCIRPLASKVLARGAHYLPALQGKPKEIVCRGRVLLCPLGQAQPFTTALAEHSRSIRIQARYLHTQQQFGNGKPLSRSCGYGRITSRRRLPSKPSGKPLVYYVLSERCLQSDFCRSSEAIGVENQLHWVRDVVFGEDACRIRPNNRRPENFATLRRNAINLIRARPGRISVRQEVKRAPGADG